MYDILAISHQLLNLDQAKVEETKVENPISNGSITTTKATPKPGTNIDRHAHHQRCNFSNDYIDRPVYLPVLGCCSNMACICTKTLESPNHQCVTLGNLWRRRSGSDDYSKQWLIELNYIHYTLVNPGNQLKENWQGSVYHIVIMIKIF